MTEQRLNRRQIHAPLEQMSRAAVTQRMDGDAAANPAIVDCRLDRGLHAALVHRRGRRLHALRAPARVRKQQMRMTMGCPKPTQNVQGLLRKRHRAVLVAFTAADMHAPTRGIDVTDLQLQAFAQAQRP